MRSFHFSCHLSCFLTTHSPFSPFLTLFPSSSSFLLFPSTFYLQFLTGCFHVLHCCPCNRIRAGPLRGTLGPPLSVYNMMSNQLKKIKVKKHLLSPSPYIYGQYYHFVGIDCLPIR
ncbi:hypothetical protein ASPVEDRAFT_852713 [Aspergillus versicolor CBS 583.65]|uniref:Uncharacterized protein n=1 Tax=Aspergillus versicolor CBS 583.65 TaxID=1036611 RepID=A0A1L9PVC3_ASPVE|nr:uncharacterized protein ASPVEDRAFT_852713 [Aspergillus versicolor CBS 583.65]OJJ05468.1 hypothetical protein ASPVEDRAFT_852713 [Aspergillus versicolor CBS 583.65]